MTTNTDTNNTSTEDDTDLWWSVSAHEVEDDHGEPVYDKSLDAPSFEVALDGLAEFATECGLRLEQNTAAEDGREYTYNLYEGDDIVVTAHIWREDL